jgi:hypothetical protein
MVSGVIGILGHAKYSSLKTRPCGTTGTVVNTAAS